MAGKKAAANTVRIYPVPGYFVPPGDFDPPILAKEQDVDEETWTKLQQYHPQPFTTTPTKQGAAAEDKEE